MGDKNTAKYGDEILSIVKDYMPGTDLWATSEKTSFAKENILESSEEKNEEKGKQEPAYQVTLQLFLTGKTVPEIAKIRERTIATIENHLIYCLRQKLIPISSLVSDETLETIGRFIAQHDFRKLSEIKAGLNDRFSYTEIKYVTAYLDTANRKL